MARQQEKSSLEKRFDSMSHAGTGRGTSKDKLSSLRPNPPRISFVDARNWYYSNGFIQNVVDAPAEDATREWITIRTNRDNDDPTAGSKGLNISRMIENRFAELGFQEKLKKLIQYSRMYNEGGYMFFGVTTEKPQEKELLREPMPATIRKLDYINVFGPDQANFRTARTNPLSKWFHSKKYSIAGYDVHESRIHHMIRSYIEEEQRGVSVIETILDAVFAQDTSLWSVTSIIFEMAVWVFKSPLVDDMKGAQLADFLAKMQAVISSQSAVAVGENEDITRIFEGTPNGLKDLFDFVFENLAGLARTPKSRLMGQSQGVITAGQFDLISYYDSIAKFQELEGRPVVEKAIDMVVRETDGEIYKTLGEGGVNALDWDFDFNPLYRIGPVEQADIELKQAQRDQIYIANTVLGPAEVRKERFGDLLEPFAKWENQPLNMETPAIVEKSKEAEGSSVKGPLSVGNQDKSDSGKKGFFKGFFG